MLNHIKTFRKKNSWQFFFIKAALFLLILFITDLITGKVFYSLYAKQKSGWEYRTKYSIENTKAEMLIFGSSRAQQQYNPIYFEDRLKLSCYNVGRDGQTILYQYPVLKAVLKRYNPKIILLECENKMFLENKDAYDRLSCLLPFYKDHPEIRSVIELRSPSERVKLLSHMYPYNSSILKIVQGISKTEDEDIKGYVPLKGVLNEPMRTVDLTIKYSLDSNRIIFYKSFIGDCKKSGIQLFLVSSPNFYKSIGSDTSLTLAKNIAKENNIPFIDLSQGHPLLNQSALYDDTVHVNQVGSKILSNIIIDSIIHNRRISN